MQHLVFGITERCDYVYWYEGNHAFCVSFYYNGRIGVSTKGYVFRDENEKQRYINRAIELKSTRP